MKIIAFKANKILLTVRVDIPDNRSFQSYQSCQLHGCKSRHSRKSHLSELPQTCRLSGLKFLSTVRVDNHSFQSHLIKILSAHPSVLSFGYWFCFELRSMFKTPGPKPFRIFMAILRSPLFWKLF